MSSQYTTLVVAQGQPHFVDAIGNRPPDPHGLVEFISFSIGEDQYGVEITAVREIKGWASTIHLPRQPVFICGVLNLRGVMVPIIDLRGRFGQGTTDATPMHAVIVVQIGGKLVSILADRVLDIVSIDAAKIQPVPYVARDTKSDLFSGLVTIENGMIALIDLQHLVVSEHDDMGGLTAAAAAA